MDIHYQPIDGFAMTIWWLAYLALGAFVGFFAGLLGVGGGGIMVPMLITLFAGFLFRMLAIRFRWEMPKFVYNDEH